MKYFLEKVQHITAHIVRCHRYERVGQSPVSQWQETTAHSWGWSDTQITLSHYFMLRKKTFHFVKQHLCLSHGSPCDSKFKHVQIGLERAQPHVSQSATQVTLSSKHIFLHSCCNNHFHVSSLILILIIFYIIVNYIFCKFLCTFLYNWWLANK